MSVNKVILIGHLGRDPDFRPLPDGSECAHLSVATDERWLDGAGKRQERTDWHRVTVFGRQVETCKSYLSKGRQVYIEGRLRYRVQEKDGRKNKFTDVIAQRLWMLGSRRDADAGAPGPDEPAAGAPDALDTAGHGEPAGEEAPM